MNIAHLNRQQRLELSESWSKRDLASVRLLLIAFNVSGCGTCAGDETLARWLHYWTEDKQLPVWTQKTKPSSEPTGE